MTTNPHYPLYCDGREVIDEMCECGHLRSKHTGPTHHGDCIALVPIDGDVLHFDICACTHFIWKAWILSPVPAKVDRAVDAKGTGSEKGTGKPGEVL